MRIELSSDKPIYYKPYRLSYTEKNKAREIVDELKEADTIEYITIRQSLFVGEKEDRRCSSLY